MEEVERALGLEPKRASERWGSSGCTYNPDAKDDPDRDCGQIARWHVRCQGEDPSRAYVFSCCDIHHGRMVIGPYKDAVMDQHEFGSCCNIERSWWIPGAGEVGSFCVTEELGVEMGYLKYD